MKNINLQVMQALHCWSIDLVLTTSRHPGYGKPKS